MLADVNAVDADGERQADAERQRLTRCEYLFIAKDARRDDGERRDAGGMAARKRALGFGPAASRTGRAGAINEQSHRSHRDPACHRRLGDRRAAAPAAQSPSESECRRDVVAG